MEVISKKILGTQIFNGFFDFHYCKTNPEMGLLYFCVVVYPSCSLFFCPLFSYFLMRLFNGCKFPFSYFFFQSVLKSLFGFPFFWKMRERLHILFSKVTYYLLGSEILKSMRKCEILGMIPNLELSSNDKTVGWC